MYRRTTCVASPHQLAGKLNNQAKSPVGVLVQAKIIIILFIFVSIHFILESIIMIERFLSR